MVQPPTSATAKVGMSAVSSMAASAREREAFSSSVIPPYIVQEKEPAFNSSCAEQDAAVFHIFIIHKNCNKTAKHARAECNHFSADGAAACAV